MTRKEAHNELPRFNSYLQWGTMHDLIDMIYDSFELRVCDNCKYQEVEQNSHKWCAIHCTSKVDNEMNYFSCNQWKINKKIGDKEYR